MQPRAIETRYKGYRFRSRLEARWAVFFDTVGFKWTYEPEGFELPSGRYLPDFYLGERQADGAWRYGPWVEVKAVLPTFDEIRKLRSLCDATCAYGLLVVGLPDAEQWLRINKHGVLDDGNIAGAHATGAHVAVHMGTDWREYAHAAVAARSARFEHGESGAR